MQQVKVQRSNFKDEKILKKKKKAKYLKPSMHEKHWKENKRERRWNERLTGDDEVRPAAIAGDGENVSEETPDWFHNQRDVIETHEHLNGGWLQFLDIFPVEVRDHTEEGAGKALADAIDQKHAQHKAGVEFST